jgi:hypothetical protein
VLFPETVAGDVVAGGGEYDEQATVAMEVIRIRIIKANNMVFKVFIPPPVLLKIRLQTLF